MLSLKYSLPSWTIYIRHGSFIIWIDLALYKIFRLLLILKYFLLFLCRKLIHTAFYKAGYLSIFNLLRIFFQSAYNRRYLICTNRLSNYHFQLFRSYRNFLNVKSLHFFFPLLHITQFNFLFILLVTSTQLIDTPSQTLRSLVCKLRFLQRYSWISRLSIPTQTCSLIVLSLRSCQQEILISILYWTFLNFPLVNHR